jgi:hypothetical protein
MRCSVLTIGSLLCDSKIAGRASWRERRLNIADKVLVKASFYYGRKSVSRGNTFTMTFGLGNPYCNVRQHDRQ